MNKSNNFIKNFYKFVSGMTFSVILLLVIIAVCIAGSIIPQEQATATYIEEYGVQGTRLILVLGLDHTFTCVWFIVLACLLCINLILCSISRFSAVKNKYKESYSLEKRLNQDDENFEIEAPGIRLPDIGYKADIQDEYEYMCGNRLGVWGSWISHFGMLVLIISFAIGQWTTKEYVVYGIPGYTEQIQGTDITVSIEDFNVDLRDDFTVEQYIASLEVSNKDGDTISGEASVNHPFEAFGYSIYQDSTGWANYVDIYEKDKLIKEDLICAGEYTYPDDFSDLVLYFNKFYPDFDADGMKSKTPLLNNPYSLYSVYYKGNVIAMDMTAMGDSIDIEDYSFIMYDPVQYTLLVIKKDPTAAIVGCSSLILVLGLFLSFYYRPYELWSDGEKIYGRAEKAPQLLEQQIKSKIRKYGDSKINGN